MICYGELDLGEDVFFCHLDLWHYGPHTCIAGEFIHFWQDDDEFTIYHIGDTTVVKTRYAS